MHPTSSWKEKLNSRAEIVLYDNYRLELLHVTGNVLM